MLLCCYRNLIVSRGCYKRDILLLAGAIPAVGGILLVVRAVSSVGGILLVAGAVSAV